MRRHDTSSSHCDLIKGTYIVCQGIKRFRPSVDFQTGRKGSLAEESMRIANGILMRSTSSPYPKPTGKAKDEAKGKDQKKGVSVSVYVDCI